MLIEYNKAHAEGNETYRLDQFQDPDFQAVPALFSDPLKWRKYYEDSNDQDKTKLRIKIKEIQKQISNVDFNDECNRKKRIR